MSASARSNGISCVAGGTIAPCRVVMLSTAAINTVLQSTGNTLPAFGVSQEGQRDPPGLSGSDSAVAAAAGDQLDIYGDGEVAYLEAGTGGFTYRTPVEADANGKGVLATGAGQHYLVGYGLDLTAAGERGRVWVKPQQITL